MHPFFLLWLILFLPPGAAILITFLTKRDRMTSASLSIGAVITSFILSVIYVGNFGWHPVQAETSFSWFKVGGLAIEFGLRADALSLMMILTVTGVASLIHIYSVAYMAEDRSMPRFFACLSLFTFAMLGIVLANNFLQLFIFWELVGVSSYLLIGFWFERPQAADAGKKAFITNRLGDFGFLLGILMVWAVGKSLNFRELAESFIHEPGLLGGYATAAGLLIFCGAMGKSAQFPLHVWLPDAMEGPTPVSALIHAATMVAAGVYMLCRTFFLFNLPGSHALQFVAWIGGFTSLLAALIAVQQNDIKRILAYSTLSQLGYMVMSVGLGGPTPAMFHLTTHAFFKALLFLGAGSVIMAMHHEQDIWAMGALRRRMPVTFWTFAVGTLALAGLWPLSGFYSKDSILAQALATNVPLFLVATFVALLTAFYMSRLVFVVFLGPNRSEASDHAHESSSTVLWPLRILAVLSVIAGVIGLDAIFGSHFGSLEAGQPVGLIGRIFAPFEHSMISAVAGLIAAALGIWAGYALYARCATDPLPARLKGLSRAMRDKFYFDEFYSATFIALHDGLAAVADFIERWIIEGFLIGMVRGGTDITGRALRLVQTGNLQTYAFLFALGVAFVLYFVLR
jgi:NADH-quinone oxidoreductase subunit L